MKENNMSNILHTVFTVIEFTAVFFMAGVIIVSGIIF